MYPSIEWKKIAGTRDILVHHYFEIDYEILWDIIQSKLDELRTAVISIIDNNP